MIDDRTLKLPGDSTSRDYYSQRPVLIVSDQKSRHGKNAAPPHVWPSVWVVPLSTSSAAQTMFDVKLVQGEGNLRSTSWARVPALQIVDKNHLGRFIGRILTSSLNDVTSQILNYLGLFGDEEEMIQTPQPPPPDEDLSLEDDSLF